MQMLDPSGQSLDPNQEYRFQDYRNFARRSVEKYFKINEAEEEEDEEDDDEFLSLPKAICLLHDFLLVNTNPQVPRRDYHERSDCCFDTGDERDSELASCK
ncbi:uncharacterized protein FRV6_09975 [Fusarium oxysporum]|uniref:Uncharacterized protein n=1 Tax=Fusarium oxysporum TaxID=5507 RepID=A0A2H3TAQ7_FUSOX|nr:uncharacterized protein FRV6_09975 [Fusarium oxysporum]